MNGILIYICLNIATLLFMSVKNRTFIINKRKKVYLESVLTLTVIILFTLIMGFRGISVGIDTEMYGRIFRRIVEASSIESAIQYTTFTGPVYVLLCKALSFISAEYQICIFFTALLVNIGLYQFVTKVSKNRVMSLFLWQVLLFFPFSMNGNRQTIAMVFALNAIVELNGNMKSCKGWGLFLLAAGIHPMVLSMSAILLGGILANHIDDRLLLCTMSVLCGIAANFVISVGYKIIVMIVPDYSKYINGKFDLIGEGRIIYVYLFLLIVVFLLCAKTKDLRDDRQVIMLLPGLIFGLILGIFNSKDILISRVVMDFVAIFIVFFPNAINSYKGNEKIIVCLCVFGALYLYSIIALLENQNGVVPYTFFVSN